MFETMRLELRKVFLSGFIRLIWLLANLLGEQKCFVLLLIRG